LQLRGAKNGLKLRVGGWGLGIIVWRKCGRPTPATGKNTSKGCRSPDDAEFDWLKLEAQVREGSRGRWKDWGFSMDLLRSKIAMSRINRKAQ